MPVLATGGGMNIVAHQDDDILFMNPDIDRAIALGEATTTVFVTAGDAGLGPAYWMGREAGAKAAYALMTGVQDWVDEEVALDIASGEISVLSSHPVGLDTVRLYFLRLPDGGGTLPPGTEQQLARLQDGSLGQVTTVDGAASYTHADLVDVLSGLMNLHQPATFRLQLSEGDNAAGEHTDHLNATEFAEEALGNFTGDTFTVRHYVQYASRGMEANLTAPEATRALDIMMAYAAHDPAVFEADGTLSQVYVDWTARQVVDRVIEVDPDHPWDVGGPLVGAPVEVGGSWSLSGPDAILFDVSVTGAITLKDWFEPSLDDAWDADGDHIYAVTRGWVGPDGQTASEDFRFETVADGRLEVMDSEAADTDPDDPAPVDPDPDTDPLDPDPVDPPPTEPDPDPSPDPVPGAVYSLGGPDAFLFEIDSNTGDISPKDWFLPSLDDAWDADGDFRYEVTRIATSEAGVTQQSVLYDTTAEGVLTPVSSPDPGPDPDPAPGPDPAPDQVPDPDPSPDPGPSPGPDPTPVPTPDPSGLFYSLAGADAQLFVIDHASGVLSTQDWFTPDYDDAWDRDEDHVYEVTRVATDPQGIATSEALRYQTLPDGRFVLQTGATEDSPDGAALMEALSLPEEDLPPDQDPEDDMDLLI